MYHDAILLEYGVVTPGALLTPLLYFLLAPESMLAWAFVAAPWLLGVVITNALRMNRSCSIDHLVLTCPELEKGIAYVHELTGVRAANGGSHPGIGTHMALLALGHDSYLEIIAPDPGQSEPERPRPFSLDDPRTHYRINAFAIHPHSPTTIEQLSGHFKFRAHDPGQVCTMSRRRPDGTLLHWRMTPLSAAAGPAPWLIDWAPAPSPAESAPKGCTLIGLRCYGPLADEAGRALEDMGLRPLDGPPSQMRPGRKVEFVHRPANRSALHENNFLVAELHTPRGRIHLGGGPGR